MCLQARKVDGNIFRRELEQTPLMRMKPGCWPCSTWAAIIWETLASLSWANCTRLELASPNQQQQSCRDRGPVDETQSDETASAPKSLRSDGKGVGEGLHQPCCSRGGGPRHGEGCNGLDVMHAITGRPRTSPRVPGALHLSEVSCSLQGGCTARHFQAGSLWGANQAQTFGPPPAKGEELAGFCSRAWNQCKRCQLGQRIQRGGENLSPPSRQPSNHSDEPSISGQSLIYFPAHTDTAERLDGTSLNIINYSSTRD
ncbi:PREDICTED: uncharacterized protein LOC109315434 [Crocodylus porosus]|uniref:uncharacterized protein LOC109315434 n=1 Tax=Crocodylus porosus TaxID=8502 RepID=UPI00093E7683|nr:PREDICTED: uncharacterized protein LOC109315434 [Crocodylus porosus]